MIVQLVVGAGLALALVFMLLSTLDTRTTTDKKSTPSPKYLSLGVLTLPWLSLIFSVFVQAELPCDGDRYEPRALVSTFVNAGAVGLLNVVSLLTFVEMLCRGVHFALAFVGWVLYWFWHAVVLYWVGVSYASNTGVVGLGTYLGLHLGSLAVAFAVSWLAALGSVPASFKMYTVAHKGVMGWVKITISAVIAAGIVVAVVLLSQEQSLRVLVSIIGDLPLLSVISISYIYYNPNTKASDLRKFTHFIQLLYKSTPLFLCIFPVALVWQETCGEHGNWGWRILTSAVVFLITGLYNLGVFLWARTYSDSKKQSRPVAYTQITPELSF